MRKLVAALAAAALLTGTSLALAAHTGPARSAKLTDDQDVGLTFSGAYATHVFTVQATGGTKLVVKSEDVLNRGDHWNVTLIDTAASFHAGQKDMARTRCGTGRTSGFSGAVSFGTDTVPYTGNAVVIVAYCSGPMVFPADMIVRFSYDGTMVVTQQN